MTEPPQPPSVSTPTPKMTADTITQYAHLHIPLTRTMGFRVVEYSGDRLTLAAPLEPNVNHQQTMFGGSIASAGVTAGWAFLWAKLREAGSSAHLVVQRSEVEFLRPVTGSVEARIELKSPDELDRFLDLLTRMGRSRWTLDCHLFCGDERSARSRCSYVAFVDPPG